MLKGIRRFSERAGEIGFLRYEDFVQDADAALKQLCERLQLRFDATYKERWSEYDRITRDSSAPSPKGIQVRPRGQLDPQFLDSLAANEDYRITLELLGYEHPQPLGEHFVAASSVVEIVDASEIDTLFEKGNRLADDKVWEDAVRYYQRVLLRRPNHVWALNNIGFCLLNLKKYDWAILELRRALEMKPDFALALANLIESYEESGRKFEAIPFQRRLVELEPEVANHAFKLSNILVSAGRVPESLHYCRQALALNPKFKAAASNYLLYLNYSDEETPESVSREHMRLAPLWWRPPRLDNAFNQPRDPDRKLRVGYVASDFYTHPVGKIRQPLIAAHASNQIEVHCYYSGKNDDHWTKRTAEASAAFHRVHEVGDQDSDQQVFSDQIEFLVDLGGYTGGGNRLQVFAARPAPVQISFLGYPNTSGLTAVDYRISDEFCDPPDENDDLFAEQTVRMSRGFLCFSPPDELPPVAALPAKTTGHITFGSFNNVAKISSSAVGAWAEILRRVPGSRLRFKYGDRFASEWMRERIRSQFAGLGVDPVRLEFLPSMPTLTEHLNAIGGVDLALDSFRYQGTMTTLETLLMGVPAVTLCGRTYSRRASSALLTRLGKGDLVADNVEQYTDIAVNLANDLGHLQRLRDELRPRLVESDICDVPAYVLELEGVYRRLWRSWCSKNSPVATESLAS